MKDVRITIPASSEYVHVLRTIAAGVAAGLDFTYDDIEDLRLAVDEACAYLLGTAAEDGTLEMGISADNGAIEILTSVEGDGPGPPRADAHATVMWHILGALTDEARFEDRQGRATIRLMKRLQP